MKKIVILIALWLQLLLCNLALRKTTRVCTDRPGNCCCTPASKEEMKQEEEDKGRRDQKQEAVDTKTKKLQDKAEASRS
jgi:hypothetical protein